MSDFDNQIQDSFGGIGKQRTVLAGTWRKYVENACAFLTDTWRVAACWQNGNRIVTTFGDNERWQWMTATRVENVSQQEALRIVAMELWRKQNPPLRFATDDSDPTPANAVQSRLWYELWQDGRQGEYEALGGEYR